MTTLRLIQISDLHLSRTRAYTYANWAAVLSYINVRQPDLVINSGDIVLNSPEDHDDLAFGYEQLSRLSVPWRSLPGDHDMGGGPPAPPPRFEAPWLGQYLVTEARREHYVDIFGEDCWAQSFGEWYLIGVNDLIWESGFAQEEKQWQFLEQHLQIAGRQPVALFMHKPPCVISFHEEQYVTYSIPAQARRRLRGLIATANVRLIGTGHLHVFRLLQTIGITVVTAPTIMRGIDDYVSANGLAVNGVIEYTFEGEAVEIRLVQPEGITKPHFPDGARTDWPLLHASEVQAALQEQKR